MEGCHGQSLAQAAYALPDQLESTVSDFVEVGQDGWQRNERLTATPYFLVDEASIPQRPTIYGTHEQRMTVSVTTAKPGAGKTTLQIAEALAKATGRKLLHDVPSRPLTVWLWNGEEPREELDRRISGVCKHYGISPADIANRLFVDTGFEQKIIIMTKTRDGLVVARPLVEDVMKNIRENNIDSLIIDPFVKTHAVNENDNGDIDQVLSLWADISYNTGCAITLVHHPRKTGGAPIAVDDIRGGGALVGAVRSGRLLNRMTSEEGEKAGVADYRDYVCIEACKNNYGPLSERQWFRLEAVQLTNSDTVAVATPWMWPDAFDGLTEARLRAVQVAVDEKRCRADSQAADWVGRTVGDVLNLDLPKDRGRIKTLLKTWFERGALVVVDGQDKRRNSRTFVKVGKWADD